MPSLESNAWEQFLFEIVSFFNGFLKTTLINIISRTAKFTSNMLYFS